MKCLVMMLLILSSQVTLAAKDERQLLKCLGAEEKKFHQAKDTGPLYDLNQRLISEMIQIPHADLTDEDYKEVCSGSSFSASWKLLEMSINKGNAIFKIPNDVSGMQRQIAYGMIEDYIEATKEIFLTLMTQIQTLSPTPECLKEEIPQLATFFNDIKYLQEDVDIKKIFAGRDVKIFQQLKNYRQAFKRCSDRLKKKLKSASKPAAKKS